MKFVPWQTHAFWSPWWTLVSCVLSFDRNPQQPCFFVFCFLFFGFSCGEVVLKKEQEGAPSTLAGVHSLMTWIHTRSCDKSHPPPLPLYLNLTKMSEWKMNRMLSSIWGKLEVSRDQRKVIKYKNWCAMVEKKCASTIYALKTLECAGIYLIFF